MRLVKLLVPATLATFIGSVSGFAQETHPHKHELSEKLGQVNFRYLMHEAGAAEVQSRRGALALVSGTTKPKKDLLK